MIFSGLEFDDIRTLNLMTSAPPQKTEGGSRRRAASTLVRAH